MAQTKNKTKVSSNPIAIVLLASLVLLFLTSIPQANAEIEITVVNHDTGIDSSYTYLKACSCGGQVDAIRVKNIGDLESHYNFELESAQPWFVLDKKDWWLRPGESVDVYVFTSAPCGTTATESYRVYVTSEYGRYRAVEKTIEMGVCENIQASITPTYQQISPCETANFELTLTNTATFTEKYEIDYLGFPWVTLQAGETKKLQGSYQATCSEWGNKTIPVVVRSVNNGLAKKLPVQVEVIRAYDYSLNIVQPELPICSGATNTIDVTIYNVEDRENTFSVSGPEGQAINVTVAPDRTALVELPFTPSRAGDRPFVVNAIGLNGSIEKQATLTVPVEACFGFQMSAPSSVNSCPGSVAIPFTITSQGSRPQDVEFMVQSNTTTSIDSLNAVLRPGEVITKTVNVIIPDATRKYYVKFIANAPNAKQEQTVTVNAYSTQACYSVLPTSHKFNVWTDQEVLPVIFTHNGLQPATYKLEYNGTFATLRETEMHLAPGQTATVHLDINASDYETGRYVDRIVLETAGIRYTSDFEIRLREKGLWQNFLDTCRADEGFRVCSASSIISLILLIASVIFAAAVISRMVKYENPRESSKTLWAVVGAILLILLLVMMIMTAPVIPRTYERPIGPSNESDLTWEIGQGQTVTLELNNYFVDPDNDTLRFTASQPGSLQVNIRDNVATVRADSRGFGVEYLVFTASDGKGGSVDSDVFTISVVPYRPVTFLEYWYRACWFLTALFLFIALAIYLLVVLLSPTEKEPRAPREPKSGEGSQELAEIETFDGRPLTRLERDVLAQQNVQNQVNAQNIIINQAPQGEKVYVASADGKRFHKMNCQIVRNMPKNKRVTFTAKEDAIKAGYSPCKTCQAHS